MLDPASSALLGIDEKTRVQALERNYPSGCRSPGRLGKREFESIRHGAPALIAAFEVRAGQVDAERLGHRTGGDCSARPGPLALRKSALLPSRTRLLCESEPRWMSTTRNSA